MVTREVIKRVVEDIDLALHTFFNLFFGGVEKCVKSKIESQFRDYSDFGKKLEDHLAEHLLFDVKEIKAPEFQRFVTEAINKQLARQ